MWREVASLADLDVSVMFAEERTRRFVWTQKDDYRSSVVRTHRLPLPRRLTRRLDEPVTLLTPRRTSRMLRDADALVVGVWWQPATLTAALHARLRGIPYLVYAESTLASRQFSRGAAARLRSLVFSRAGAVLVPGPAAAAAAMTDGAAPHRVVESGNSVGLDLFHDRVRKLRASEVSDVAPRDGHRFVCIGQLIERKNVEALIRAFATLDDGSATLDVAGDGRLAARLRRTATELGVGERVRFLGFRTPDEILVLLAESHTLVLPSTEEVYGYTALEAYVGGLDVIVSERAGVASTLDGRPSVQVVAPTVDGLRAGLGVSLDTWTGWHDHDVEFASPARAARDVLRAVEIARAH